MKKKIALVLAAMMAVTSIPATPFTSLTSVYGNTTNAVSVAGTANRRNHRYDGSRYDRGIAHFFDLVVTQSIPANTQFRLELTNAEFYNTNDVTVNTNIGPVTLSAIGSGNDAPFLYSGRFIDSTGIEHQIATSGLNTVSSASLWGVPIRDEDTPFVLANTVAGAIRTHGDVARAQDENGSIINDSGSTNGRYIWTNVMYYGSRGQGIANTAPDNAVALRRTPGNARSADGVFLEPVQAGQVIRIPLPIRTDNVLSEVTIRVSESQGRISSSTFVLLSTSTPGTTTNVSGARLGGEIIFLDGIQIREHTAGRFEDGGPRSFELIAPAGYRFRNSHTGHIVHVDGNNALSLPAAANLPSPGNMPRPITVTTSGDVHFRANEVVAYFTDTRDHTSMAISVNLPNISNIASSIFVQGIQLEPLGRNVRNEDRLYMDIRSFDETRTSQIPNHVPVNRFAEGQGGISSQSFHVATAREFGVNATIGSVRNLHASHWDHRVDLNTNTTARIVLEENDAGSWLAGRTTTFTLPEGVYIRGIRSHGERNISSPWRQGNNNSGGWQVPSMSTLNRHDVNSYISIDRNVMTIRNLEIDITENNRNAMIDFELYLSIAPSFGNGEILMEIGGSALPEDISLPIANAVQPIEVQTNVTDVNIGFQRFSVADIVITENYAGAIRRENDGLRINMSDELNFNSGLRLAPIHSSQVRVDGDLAISLRNTRDGIVFDVDRESRTPSTITISDVEVFVDRTVPFGEYNIIVSGDSVFTNGWQRDSNGRVENSVARFNEEGFIAPIINVVTEGVGAQHFTDHVAVSEGSAIALLNGEEVTLEIAPYLSTASDSFMIPLRFVSNLFGIEDHNIMFDNASRMATIVTPNRTVQFTIDSSTKVVSIDGGIAIPSTMLNAAGQEVRAEINNDRLFIPFRAVGEAFGITNISWDDETRTAHFNRPTVETTENE